MTPRSVVEQLQNVILVDLREVLIAGGDGKELSRQVEDDDNVNLAQQLPRAMGRRDGHRREDAAGA